MKLSIQCPYCSKPLDAISETPVSPTEKLVDSRCGHSFVITRDATNSTLVLTSVDGTKKARNYQEYGVEFQQEAGGNCIIADQMRLGKTPQALLYLSSNKDTKTPALIIVKATNLWQWIREYKTWTNSLPLGIWPIIGTKNIIPPGFSAYIISMDTLGRGDMVKELLTFGFKHVIVDEAHSFKDPNSKRSKALISFLAEISKAEEVKELTFICPLCSHHWTDNIVINNTTTSTTASKASYCPKCNAFNRQTVQKERIFTERACSATLLTGTPIINRADEYFVPLNVVAPWRFQNHAQFRREWLTDDYKRIKPWKLDEFKATIKPFVLRREKEDVYTDLPAINRMFTVIKVEDERLKKLYNATLDRIEAKLVERNRDNFTFFENIGDLAILRQICGLSKVNYVSEIIQEDIEESDRVHKFAIGIHHHSVRDNLTLSLQKHGVLKVSGEDSPERKDYVMRHFEQSSDHCVIINMEAGGVGMDFHYVDNVVITERMWSYAKEEQFEYRFYNPDKSIMGENRNANIEYVLAEGTIDQWFHDAMYQPKKDIFESVVAEHVDITTDQRLFRDLMEQTVSRRLR